MKMSQQYRDVGRNILVMIGFGILSALLGYIRFIIPGMEGGGSDMREIGVLLSILFLPNWIYMLGVSFISSLSLPMHNLEVSTILMHCTASLFGWFFYSYIKNKTSNVYFLGGMWALMVIVYYMIFLIPTLVIVFYLFKTIERDELFNTYKKVLYAYRFELTASTMVTTLFLVLFKTARLLAIRNKELKKALLKSEESDRLKTAFINNINHEIRTPLNGIIGFADLIVEPDIDNEQRKAFSKGIISSSDRLLSTISHIIEISKIRTEQIKLKNDNVSVRELFSDISLAYSSLAREKNLLFECDCAGLGSSDIIVTDKGSLRQILDHLLSNAFKFTKEGSVRVSCIKKGDLMEFSVKDSGQGIATDLYEKIFKDFFKVENKNDQFHPGTGLGLSISKELAQFLGGNIYVDSIPGKGSTFSLSLPVNQK